MVGILASNNTCGKCGKSIYLPVHIMLCICRELEINNVTKLWYVQPTRCNLSGNHKLESAVAEAIHYFLPKFIHNTKNLLAFIKSGAKRISSRLIDEQTFLSSLLESPCSGAAMMPEYKRSLYTACTRPGSFTNIKALCIEGLAWIKRFSIDIARIFGADIKPCVIECGMLEPVTATLAHGTGL
jgi:hypothetical protein